jgi:starch synthase
VGDVVRDLPAALATRGWQPAVLTPAYGVFASLPGAALRATIDVSFGGAVHAVELYEVPGADASVRHYALDHALFTPRGPGLIYCDDDADTPFATDASKFAFFCAAAAAALEAGALQAPQIIHLHDWQTALFLALREFEPAYAALKKIRTVFTIHNLSLQGVRPLAGDSSSLRAWFPRLYFRQDVVTDRRWPDCVNPMAVGIRLADSLNTVSPTYAREILEPSAPERGYSGGEGLEMDLQEADANGRLAGILNGCAYPAKRLRRPGWSRLLATMRSELTRWIARETPMASAHYLADQQLAQLPARRPDALLTSVGRIGAQKTRLFREQTADGVKALEGILAKLGTGGLFIMLGNGESEYETYLAETGATHSNFLFLRAYSDHLAQQLYAGGDLFLMPSSFEPCGISQMLAMRAGQLCVVHGVGGLKDTVSDNSNGFDFDGLTSRAQADNFVCKVAQALELRKSSAERWRQMRQAAATMRFDWNASAAAYEGELYGIDGA